jgi:pyruvate/2-oxoglutarate dehydrogenase complex dihydrolipoamide acyltransferase (E2) component
VHPESFRTLPATDPRPALPAALRSAAAAARRRAVRAGDGEIDTGHLLHSLLESDPVALAAAAPQPRQVARLMGYLVQRSIGFGRGWRATAEHRAPSSAGGRVTQPPPPLPCPAAAGGPPWSLAAIAALERAAADCVGRHNGMSLLAELAAESDSRAAQILRAAGIDPAVVRARCAQGRSV